MSQSESVSVDALPKSIDAFCALRDEIAHTPQGGAAMMVFALLVHVDDETLGRQCLTMAVDRGRLQEGEGGYQNLRLARRAQSRIDQQLAAQPYLPRAYIRGAAPENGYQLPDPPYVIEFAHNPHGGDQASGRIKVFVVCSGAASPRPVTVCRNSHGVWKADEWSSLVMGIIPVAGLEDDL
ncbi:MAG: DUF6935 domain-containing protein [Anaerolineae bacterium]